jgi:hypothetical protein
VHVNSTHLLPLAGLYRPCISTFRYNTTRRQIYAAHPIPDIYLLRLFDHEQRELSDYLNKTIAEARAEY